MLKILLKSNRKIHAQRVQKWLAGNIKMRSLEGRAATVVHRRMVETQAIL
ncbi:hypothetical protein [Rhizobium laguerreae]|nr:hypothetical protein [Rhizobium laguerreae]MBY3511323.1 hypothetical protein [Rhizobium laguerreae]